MASSARAEPGARWASRTARRARMRQHRTEPTPSHLVTKSSENVYHNGLCHLHDDEHQDDDDQHADNGADNASVHCVPPSLSEWVRQSTRSSVALMAECRDARSKDCRSGRVSRPGHELPPAFTDAVEVQGRRIFVHTLC